MSIENKAWQTAWQNRSLVYGAIKSIGIDRRDPNYEDLVQTGLMQYAKLLAAEPAANNGWIFQKIKWTSLDYLRRRGRCWLDLEISTAKFSIEDYLAIEELLPQLSVFELVILRCHLLNGISLAQLANSTGCSYRTLKRKKADLCRHLRSSLTS